MFSPSQPWVGKDLISALLKGEAGASNYGFPDEDRKPVN